jgi:hypothetical protein
MKNWQTSLLAIIRLFFPNFRNPAPVLSKRKSFHDRDSIDIKELP